MNSIVIYTDGGCSGNPGRGAWAFVQYDSSGSSVEKSGSADLTTNNKMELTAVIQALKFCLQEEEGRPLSLFTDSRYVQKGITEWIRVWLKNGWRTSGKKPVKNKELWQELLALNEKLKVEWSWVKGHANSEGNTRCHNLVEKELRSASIEP